MKTRIISGLCMLPMLILLYLGSYWLTALAMFVGFMGLWEFNRGFRAMGVNPSHWIGFVALFVLYAIQGIWPNNHMLICAWLVGVIMASSLYMFKVTERTPIDAMATMVGVIYIVFFSFHVTLVDYTGPYSILRWLIIFSAFGSDICAYFTGVFLGKHKMTPNLSPKKTWEGAIGGVIGSAVVCGLFGFIFAREYLVSCIIIGILGSVISMCGDLTASAYKRKMGIKDYGKLIPGHGGIMDRFDSVLFTAPVVYYYIVIVLQHFGANF